MMRLCAVPCIFLALLACGESRAGTVRQLTDDRTGVAGGGALDDAGSVVFVGTSADLLGTNPEHRFELVRLDPITAVPSAVATFDQGIAAAVSVSDDGVWLAFASPADLTGQNHDRSSELYVMRSDGTGLAQLTDDPAPNAGSVGVVTISGDGNTIAFSSNTDPLGTNPTAASQLFVIGRDGSGLTQLTAAADGGLGGFSIGDDGTRLAFAHGADLTGGNPDLGSEVFAIQADGSGLAQLTATAAGFGSGGPSLSGNGQRIAFQSNGDLTGGNLANQTEIFVIDFAGTNLAQLTSTAVVIGITGDPASSAPSITDDGQTIVFQSNNSRIFPPLNIDGNFEIYRIQADGSGLTVLTSTLLEAGSFLPTVAGGGGRIVFFAIDSDVSLRAMDGNGAGEIDLLVFDIVLNAQPDVTPDGTRAVFVRTPGLFGGDQLWRVETAGGVPAQITSFASGAPASPSIAGDNDTIVFSADSNPTGGNGDASDEIFRIQADGSGIAQLTSGPLGTASSNPGVAANAAVVIFDSDTDPLGGNVDLSRELFRINLDGTGLVQLTSGPADTTSRRGRIDASGTWVVFESNADLDGGNADGSFEVFRIRSDGTQLERLTGDPMLGSGSPDIDAAGARIVYATATDPTGGNADGNQEIFGYEPATLTTTQLTATTEGSSGGPRISGDGGWVYFSSSAPFFEQDPDEPGDLYRVPAVGGAVERVGALRAGAIGGLGAIGTAGGGSSAIVPDDSGDVAVFTGLGDFTQQNPDVLSELWAIDINASSSIVVGAELPTPVSWTHESGPLRYDVIRGDVASLADGGATVDLGAVVCLEDDSPDADIAGFEDAALPTPGQAFFYVYRGSRGLLDGPGSYGSASDGRERVTAAGDCAPN